MTPPTECKVVPIFGTPRANPEAVLILGVVLILGPGLISGAGVSPTMPNSKWETAWFWVSLAGVAA